MEEARFRILSVQRWISGIFGSSFQATPRESTANGTFTSVLAKSRLYNVKLKSEERDTTRLQNPHESLTDRPHSLN